MKEKLTNTLGALGGILYFVISILVSILPFVMIDCSFWITFLLISIEMFIPATSIIFWIWGLVCAIQGVQDIWAIIYYVLFAIMYLPFFVSTISAFFSKD